MRKLFLTMLLMMGLGLAACTNTPTQSTTSSGEPESSITDSSGQEEGDPKTSETSEEGSSEQEGTSEGEQNTSEESGGDTSEQEGSSSEENTSEEGSSSEGEGSAGSEGSEQTSGEGEEQTHNDGTLEHPFTVSEGYAIAAELEANADTGAQYFTTGVVTGAISFYKGRLSFDFTDGEHTLRVYNMNNEENKASYKDGEYDIKEGDTLIVAGTYKNYVKDGVSTLEICYVKDVANCYRAG